MDALATSLARFLLELIITGYVLLCAAPLVSPPWVVFFLIAIRAPRVSRVPT